MAEWVLMGRDRALGNMTHRHVAYGVKTPQDSFSSDSALSAEGLGV